MPKKDGCKGKRKHHSLLAAQIVCRKMKNAQMHVYKCDKCKCYHVGRAAGAWAVERRLDQLFNRIHRDDAKRNKPM